MSEISPGRRVLKKAAAREAIVEAATRLFGRHGFAGTRIDAIADAAKVAVGTVYNHFSTKTDILVEILLADMQSVVRDTSAIVADPGTDAAEAIHAFVAIVIERMERRPRALWRQVFGQSFIDAAGLGVAFANALGVFTSLLRTVLERQRLQGVLDARHDIEQAAAIAYGLAHSLVTAYVRDDRIGARETSTALLQQLRIVFA